MATTYYKHFANLRLVSTMPAAAKYLTAATLIKLHNDDPGPPVYSMAAVSLKSRPPNMGINIKYQV